MADGECCERDTGTKKNCLLKTKVDLLSISHKNSVCNDRLHNMKDSFFMCDKRGELCRCLNGKSVVSSDVHALNLHCVGDKSSEHVEFTQICDDNEENCRKKRCTDRYDSSESSDSGVAALSSSSTSDITEPGSPFSTASTHSSHSESGDEKYVVGTNLWPDAGPKPPPPATPPTQRNFIIAFPNADSIPKISQPTTEASATSSPGTVPKISSLNVRNDSGVKSVLLSLSPRTVVTKPLNIAPLASIQTRSTAFLSPPSLPLEIPQPLLVLREQTATSEENNVLKTSNQVWSSSNGVYNTGCELPLTTLALTVPSYCVLSTNPVDSCTPRSLPLLVKSSPPRTYHWTPGVPNVTSYLIAGSSLISQRKCILVTTPTTNCLNVSNVNCNTIPGLLPVLQSSPPNFCVTQTNIGVNQSVHLVAKSNTMPPNIVQPVDNVTSVKSFEWKDISSGLAPSGNTSSENASSVNALPLPFVPAAKPCTKKQATSKPLPKLVSRTKRPKPDLTPAEVVVPTVCVTRQQTQKCSVKLHKLPAHEHNTRKCAITERRKDGKVPQQGKITKYFKTEMKPPAISKDSVKDLRRLTGMKKVIPVDKQNCESNGLDKYFKMAKKIQTTACKNNAMASPVQIFLVNKLESDSKVTKLLKEYVPQPNGTLSPRKTQPPPLKVPDRPNVMVSSTKPTFLLPSNQNFCKKSPQLSKKPIVSELPRIPKVSAVSETSETQVVVTEEIVESSSSIVTDDSESGVSSALSVIVSSTTSCCQLLSPILSAPKTIRFPAAQRKALLSKQHGMEDKTGCRWAECSETFESGAGLVEHLQTHHVLAQASGEHFVCLWVGCKVYARSSCSRSWLERHVLAHGGNKPFRCIVDNCGQRFGSNMALERHVNGHFDQEGGTSQGQRRSLDAVANKMLKRNGKKLRYRKQPWSARMFDYFDSGIMEGLQHRLVTMNQPGETPANVVLTSKVLARRVTSEGVTQYLVRWTPEDFVDDEWIADCELVSSRTVPLKSQTQLQMKHCRKHIARPNDC